MLDWVRVPEGEGWALFEWCTPNVWGEYVEIGTEDELGRFSSDEGAADHVVAQAAQGEAVALKALALLSHYSPRTYRVLMARSGVVGG